MRPVSNIFSDMVKSLSSGGVQFLVTLVTTPIMTRLYAPEAYASFGILFTLATTLLGIGLCSLPSAYPLEQQSGRRQQLLAAMIRLVLVQVAIACLLALLLHQAHGIALESGALLLLPLLVLTLGGRIVLVAIATARKEFGRLAYAQSVEPFCSRGGSIALGAAISGNPAWIMLSVAIGHTLITVMLLTRLRDALRQHARAIMFHPHPFRGLWKHYHDFIGYHTIAYQSQPLLILAIQLLISTAFSHEFAGHYILATSILTLPISLIAMTTAPVFYRYLIDDARTTPSHLPVKMIRSTAIYLLIGGALFLPLYWLGAPLFAFAFGEPWRHAGAIAGILGAAYATKFAYAPVSSIFRVSRRLRLQFVLETLTCVLLLLAVFMVLRHLPFDQAMLYLCIGWVLRYLILFVGCIHAAYYPHSAREVIA
jgi:O-antigen/teichoic acid export membrane protein